VDQSVVLAGGQRLEVVQPPRSEVPTVAPVPGPSGAVLDHGPAVRAPLGVVVGARSGDKGGNSNVGVWARSDRAFDWLDEFLTTDMFKALAPECANLEIRRYGLPNIRAINFVVVGLLGKGVSSSTRHDPQAKSLGEFLRSRIVDVPAALIEPVTQKRNHFVG
jgi:hypothetical protein